jgi:uncharacterized protein
MESSGKAAREALVASLGLKPHPEGGYFDECYRSSDASGDLPERFGAERGSLPFCTSIYYLLAGSDFSAFHRIKSDELWYFHEGSGMVVHAIERGGEYRRFELGPGGAYFCAVRAGSWFSAEPYVPGPAAGDADEAFALVSCAVSPGFDFRDFEIAGREELAAAFPRHRTLIERFTRP